MRYRALDVYLGPDKRHVGLLFQYGEGATAITRLRPDLKFWLRADAPTFAQAAVLSNATERATFLREYALQPFFNGQGEQLPPFFQNLLPEGPLRRHLEQLGGLIPGDHFGMLAICGTDLPGAVYVSPADLDRESVADIVTQRHDALEMSVAPVPVPEATSLSGVQPKLSLVEQGGRYVARTKDAQGVHIIAKLPTVEYAMLPEVEELTLRLAHEAGADVCRAKLAPVSQIVAEQPFPLGGARDFLAVERFDRTPSSHIHCEDFAQIIGIPPDEKYTHARATYSTIATVLATMPGLGQEAVQELLRRIVVNDLVGNYDGHVKNYGLLYRDGRTASLSPAYDVVAYAAYLRGSGHALAFTPGGTKRARVTPSVVREFANAVPGLTETKAQNIVRQTVKRAYDAWPGMIAASSILPEQKELLMAHFLETPAIASLKNRAATVAKRSKP